MKYAAALGLCLLTSPGLADAVTYQGTIGDLDVVVEFSEQPLDNRSELFGRYFYVDRGVDIPLHSTPAARASIGLAEEVPCSAESDNCRDAQDETPSEPPLGARWELKFTRDGTGIEGEWINNGRSQPVWLTSVGWREFDPAEGLQGLLNFAGSLFYSGDVLTSETSPYDYLKVTSVPLVEGDIVHMQDAAFRFVADPRTKFQFPRIVELADDHSAANTHLEQRHWTMSLDALGCMAQQYQSFGWNDWGSGAGTLGSWDEEQVDVHYLSPTVMTWTEGGSLFCGGAHPYNHYEFHNLDVRTGEPLDLSRIFADWVFHGDPADLDEARDDPETFQWGPGEELLAFVNAHRRSNQELGFGGPDDCPIDELIPQYLAIAFKGDDTVLFSMDGLPHVAAACASDLYEAPITDLRDLLTDEAADYFPILAE